MSEWKPIKTAPDNTQMLIFDDNGFMWIAHIYNGELISYTEVEGATYWMPLPDPPE